MRITISLDRDTDNSDNAGDVEVERVDRAVDDGERPLVQIRLWNPARTIRIGADDLARALTALGCLR